MRQLVTLFVIAILPWSLRAEEPTAPQDLKATGIEELGSESLIEVSDILAELAERYSVKDLTLDYMIRVVEAWETAARTATHPGSANGRERIYTLSIAAENVFLFPRVSRLIEQKIIFFHGSRPMPIKGKFKAVPRSASSRYARLPLRLTLAAFVVGGVNVATEEFVMSFNVDEENKTNLERALQDLREELQDMKAAEAEAGRQGQ